MCVYIARNTSPYFCKGLLHWQGTKAKSSQSSFIFFLWMIYSRYIGFWQFLLWKTPVDICFPIRQISWCMLPSYAFSSSFNLLFTCMLSYQCFIDQCITWCFNKENEEVRPHMCIPLRCRSRCTDLKLIVCGLRLSFRLPRRNLNTADTTPPVGFCLIMISDDASRFSPLHGQLDMMSDEYEIYHITHPSTFCDFHSL